MASKDFNNQILNTSILNKYLWYLMGLIILIIDIEVYTLVL